MWHLPSQSIHTAGRYVALNREPYLLVRLADKINGVTKWILIALLVSCVSISFAEVICRYWFHIAIGWGNEFCRFTLIWMAFIAAGHAARQGRMVKLEIIFVLFKSASEKIQSVFEWISGLISIAFYIIAILCTWSVMQKIHGLQYSAALIIPMSLMYSSIVVGSVLLIMNTVAALLSPINKSDVSEALALAEEMEKLTNEKGEFINVDDSQEGGTK